MKDSLNKTSSKTPETTSLVVDDDGFKTPPRRSSDVLTLTPNKLTRIPTHVRKSSISSAGSIGSGPGSVMNNEKSKNICLDDGRCYRRDLSHFVALAHPQEEVKEACPTSGCNNRTPMHSYMYSHHPKRSSGSPSIRRASEETTSSMGTTGLPDDVASYASSPRALEFVRKGILHPSALASSPRAVQAKVKKGKGKKQVKGPEQARSSNVNPVAKPLSHAA